MRKISIPWPHPDDLMGLSAEVPVLVDWFPPLTETQVLQNAWAEVRGERSPHDDPNLFIVSLERQPRAD